MSRAQGDSLSGRKVLITGAARGIGAALAVRLAERGAHVALAGLEPERLAEVAERAGSDGTPAPWRECNVAHCEQVDRAVEELVAELGGLDIVIANAGVAAQLPLIGGDVRIMERTLGVNVLGTYYTLRAAGPHIAHAGGYALLTSSAAAAVHLPLMGAYSASKSAVEALGNTLRIELRSSGTKVGVAYFAELDTEMTSRGFGTKAAAAMTGGGSFSGLGKLDDAIDRIERGIAGRSRRIVAPWWVAPILPLRMLLQPIIELRAGRGLNKALQIARNEHAELTTPQPD